MSNRDPRRVFITGISGLLGLNAALQWRHQIDIAGCYLSRAVSVPCVDIVPLDLEDRSSTLSVIAQFRPDVVLHTAALTDVDRCEADATLARRRNVEVTRVVAEAAAVAGARLVHISTDQLCGDDGSFHDETAIPSPMNVYARTKLEAEQAIRQDCPDALIVRTNFVGWGTSTRTSFFDWVYNALETGAPLQMFVDVFFTPIAVNDLLDCVLELVGARVAGVVNIAGSQRLSKYDFGVAVARVFGHPIGNIEPCGVEDASLVARRPHDMSLSTERVSGMLYRRMPDAEAAIQRLKTLRDAGWTDVLERTVRASREELAVASDQERTGGQVRQLRGRERS